MDNATGGLAMLILIPILIFVALVIVGAVKSFAGYQWTVERFGRYTKTPAARD